MFHHLQRKCGTKLLNALVRSFVGSLAHATHTMADASLIWCSHFEMKCGAISRNKRSMPDKLDHTIRK